MMSSVTIVSSMHIPSPQAQQGAHALYERAHHPAAHRLPKAHAVQPQAPNDQRQALKWIRRFPAA